MKNFQSFVAIARLKTSLFVSYLYLLFETMFKSHVNLLSCIVITVTNWNCLKSKLELKQMEWTLKITNYFNCKIQAHQNQTILKVKKKI